MVMKLSDFTFLVISVMFLFLRCRGLMEDAPASTQDRCSLPPKKGPCKAILLSYYFDRSIGSCSFFFFGGCQGNANNFNSLEECSKVCGGIQTQNSSAKKRTCRLPYKMPYCGVTSNRWYYHPLWRRCISLDHGGCDDGLALSFLSKLECEKECSNSNSYYLSLPYNRQRVFCKGSVYGCCDDGVTTALGSNGEGCMVLPSFCELPAAVGRCVFYENRWFYDVKEQLCKRFSYGGCYGNRNNFLGQEECEEACAPDRWLGVATNAICFLPPLKGPCSQLSTRWYFDITRGSCVKFSFGGCKGNTNNFPTQLECESFCNMSSRDWTLRSSLSAICYLDLDQGHQCVAGGLTRWRFNVLAEACESFLFLGCGGNENNFDSIDQCRSLCPTPKGTADQQLRDELTANNRLLLPGKDLEPSQVEPMIIFQGNETLRDHLITVYTGCNSRYGCCDDYLTPATEPQQRGCPVYASPCDYRPVATSCSQNTGGWFFSHVNNRCLAFRPGFCAKNRNSFPSRSLCEAVCMRKA